MKKTLHILFILSCLLWIAPSGQSQDLRKPLLIQDNRSWNTRITSAPMPDYYTACTRITFLQGDTLIGETRYQKTFRSYYKDRSQAEYAGCLRQEGNRVFLIGKDKDQEVLLYDFGLETGDTFLFDASVDGSDLTYPGTVVSTDSIAIDGIKHKRIRFGESERGAWIEGIGSTDDILTHYTWDLAGGCGYLLLCCYDENGEKMYQSDLTQETFVQKPQDNMIGEGTRWTDHWYSRLAGTGGEATYYLEGDTLINSELYWKVNLEGYGKYNPFALLREDRDSTIYIRFLYDSGEIQSLYGETYSGPDYFFVPETHKDCLLYSFGNWQVGEKWPYVQNATLDTLEITRIGATQLADGLTYKTINRTIQTVGSEEGVFNPYTGHPTNGTHFYLKEYYRKGVPLYRENAISETKTELRISSPAKGTVVFRTNNLPESRTITLSDLSGKAIRAVRTAGSSETVIGNLPQGIYLYEVEGTAGLKGKVAVW